MLLQISVHLRNKSDNKAALFREWKIHTTISNSYTITFHSRSKMSYALSSGLRLNDGFDGKAEA